MGKPSAIGWAAQELARLKRANTDLRRNNVELRKELRALRALHFAGRGLRVRTVSAEQPR